MSYKKNKDGFQEYYHEDQKGTRKKIQEDRIRGQYKRGKFPPEFFENIEKKLTPGLRGYWAFYIDGDGCVHSRNGGLSVMLGSSDLEPVQYLADLYGTSIVCKKFSKRKWRPHYTTALHGERALHFLHLICPYMTEKRRKVTQLINIFDPNYHPPKIPMNFRQNPDLLNPHMGMIAGLFDSEGSVGMRIQETKSKTKTGEKRTSYSISSWISFHNTNVYLLRKIKKILESSPFTFKPVLHKCNRKKRICKQEYQLKIPTRQHLLFMKMFSHLILITRKREYTEKFERKEQVYKICTGALHTGLYE